MAEIKIEKRKGIWLWIVGIVIFALLVYLFAFKSQNNLEYENEVLRHFIGDQNMNKNTTSDSGFYDREEFNISRTWKT